MGNKKGTGWIPDYPDVRDYRLGQIEDRLGAKIQDIQITNDLQGTLDQILDLIKDKVKDGDTDSRNLKKLEEIKKTISGSFQLVKAKALQEQKFLAPGSIGYEVYDLQKKLFSFANEKDRFGGFKEQINNLLKSVNEADYIEYGYFGQNTEKAVNQFKSIFELPKNSIADPVAIYTLDVISQIIEAEKSENVITKEKKENFQEGETSTTFKLGDFDPKIKDIQENLETLGYLEQLGEDKGAITGFFDQLTEKAIKDLQYKNHLYVDGRFNEDTKKKLEELIKNTSAVNDKSVFPELKKGIRGESVEDLQSRLKQLEEFNGQITGYFGSLTEAAVKSFQAKYGLVVDGIAGKRTWEVLHKLDQKNKKRKQKPLVITASSPIPIELYKIILKTFEISEKILKAEHFVNEKGFQPATDTDVTDTDRDRNVLKRTIDMIVKLVAQIISPLAQHRNLEKAVKDGLERIDKWFSTSTDKDVAPLIKQQNKEENFVNSDDIKSVIKSALWEFQTQSLSERNSGYAKTEQKINWNFNPLYLPLNISIVLNLKKSLYKIYLHENQQDYYKTLNKINDIFQSINHLDFESMKNSGFEEYFEKSNTTLLSRENNGLETQQNSSRTIEILMGTDDESSEARKILQSQFDLEVPIDWNLHKSINMKQKEINTSVYFLIPRFVDLSFWCSPIEDQGSLNSCTAYTGIALMEYFEKRSFDRYIDASPRFLYKVTRNLMHRLGDAGASLRETMKAMALFGVPPEEYWSYEEDKFDEEPTPFCYSFAQSYQALKYFRLNPAGTSEEILLLRIKTVLAAGFPCAFGFTSYHSIDDDSNPRGHIPYPTEKDRVKGGHAVVAVGYDDQKIIKNADGIQLQGALLIRNSWGTNWGEGGYGWLPYDYVLEGLTADWWSLLKSEWFETGNFGLGANDWMSNFATPRTRPQPSSNPKPKNQTSSEKPKNTPNPASKRFN